MRYVRDKQVTRSHLAATAKAHPEFKYTLIITGIFTEWSVLEFYGFDHEKNRVEVYGEPDARVGVTSIPEYVSCLRFLLQVDEILILDDSIAHYTVSSVLIPFQPTKAFGSATERTIRVQGSTCTFQGLVDALGAARGVKYETQYLDPTDAKEKEELARIAGDEEVEMQWSIRPLIASGFVLFFK